MLVTVEVRTTPDVDSAGAELDDPAPVTAPASELDGTADELEETGAEETGAELEPACAEETDEEAAPALDEARPEADELGPLEDGTGAENVVIVGAELIVTVELRVRVIVSSNVLVEVDSTDELPVTAPAELPAGGGGRMPLVMSAPLDARGPWPLVAIVVKVSGQTVVDIGTTDVTTEAEPESGQSVTEPGQL